MKIAGGRSLPHAPIGLSIGLEQSVLLVWDRNGGVTLFNQAAEIQASAQFPGLIQGSLSADGSTPAVLLANGTLLLLRQDLSVRLEIAAGKQVVPSPSTIMDTTSPFHTAQASCVSGPA